eukprot:1335707-Prymnesium_polylepis.1
MPSAARRPSSHTHPPRSPPEKQLRQPWQTAYGAPKPRGPPRPKPALSTWCLRLAFWIYVFDCLFFGIANVELVRFLWWLGSPHVSMWFLQKCHDGSLPDWLHACKVIEGFQPGAHMQPVKKAEASFERLRHKAKLPKAATLSQTREDGPRGTIQLDEDTVVDFWPSGPSSPGDIPEGFYASEDERPAQPSGKRNGPPARKLDGRNGLWQPKPRPSAPAQPTKLSSEACAEDGSCASGDLEELDEADGAGSAGVEEPMKAHGTFKLVL